MPVSEQPGRKYVPRRKPTVTTKTPEYKCMDLELSSVDIIKRHLKRIAAKCPMDGTKLQIAKLLEHSEESIIKYIEEPDRFYHQHVSTFEQLLASTFDYLCLNEYRAVNFISLLENSDYWTQRYMQAHDWIMSLLNNVKVDMPSHPETEADKQKQSHWLKFCLIRERLKRLDTKGRINMWAATAPVDLSPLIPIFSTIVKGMNGEQREHMETLFVIRPGLFVEIYQFKEHESIVYQCLELFRLIFNIPTVYTLDCLDEISEATGLTIKELVDAVVKEGQHYVLKSSVEGESQIPSSLGDMMSPEGAKMVAQLQRLGRNPELCRKRLLRWIEDTDSTGSKIWKCLEPKANDLGFTWDKLKSGIGSNWQELIQPRISAYWQEFKSKQSAEKQAQLNTFLQNVRDGVRSAPLPEDMQEANIDEEKLNAMKAEMDKMLGQMNE